MNINNVIIIHLGRERKNNFKNYNFYWIYDMITKIKYVKNKMLISR